MPEWVRGCYETVMDGRKLYFCVSRGVTEDCQYLKLATREETVLVEIDSIPEVLLSHAKVPGNILTLDLAGNYIQ